MSSLYTCLTCGATLSLNDINVAGDTALCRKCGNASAFSLISSISSLTDTGMGKPPRGVRVERDPMGGGVTITHWHISLTALFFIPFTVLWSGIPLGSIYVPQLISGTFDRSRSLLGIPFLLGTVALVCVTLTVLFGKHVITLRRGEGTAFYGIGKLGRTRRFTYSRDAKIALRPADIGQGDTPTTEIAVLNQGTTFGMCASIPDTPKRFIAGWLQREIARGT